MYMVAGVKRWSDEEVVEGQEGLTGTNNTIKVKFTNKWAIKSSPDDDQTISDIEMGVLQYKMEITSFMLSNDKLKTY